RRQQYQSQTAAYYARVSGARSHGGDPLEQNEAQRKADRKMKRRHNRVGIAEVRVVMLVDGRNALKAAEEVYQEHSRDRVAAKLIQGHDARSRAAGLCRRHDVAQHTHRSAWV